MIPSIDLLLPTEILTIIDAIITAVLAVITYYYAKETGLRSLISMTRILLLKIYTKNNKLRRCSNQVNVGYTQI
jgi:hypothetical protein